MKKMSKRLLAFVLCLVMVFGVLGIPGVGATNASETAQPDSSNIERKKTSLFIGFTSGVF